MKHHTRSRISVSTSCALAALTLVVALSGCRIESDKHGDGDNVKIATPFGGMQVKTDDSVVANGIGLPVYPGATLIKKKENGKESGAADVNMSFGSFALRVKAMSYHSDDSPAKIAAFYRTALAKYGDIIQCEHNHPVGSPSKTSQGLTCDNQHGNHIDVTDSEDSKMELKTGSQQHQHIVALDPDGGGTKIGLVALDLPGKLSFGDSKDDDKE
jgi:hypothetical protein